jgi:transcription initiation factor TFIIH subunit 3
MEERGVLQVIILDGNNSLWKERAHSLSSQSHSSHSSSNSSSHHFIGLDTLLRCLFVFLNSHLAMSRENLLSLLIHTEYSSQILFPSSDLIRTHGEKAFIPLMTSFGEEMIEKILEHCLETSTNTIETETKTVAGTETGEREEERQQKGNEKENRIRRGNLSSALSQALCGLLILLCSIIQIIVINRRLQLNPALTAKILLVQISPDVPHTYNHVMNCVFSAQKLFIPIDSLVVSSESSSFLQQATFLTGGVYLKPKDQRSTLQVLLSHVLPSGLCRKLLKFPLQVCSLWDIFLLSSLEKR